MRVSKDLEQPVDPRHLGEDNEPTGEETPAVADARLVPRPSPRFVQCFNLTNLSRHFAGLIGVALRVNLRHVGGRVTENHLGSLQTETLADRRPGRVP